MPAQHGAQRQLRVGCAARLQSDEYRRFAEPATQPDTDQTKHTAQDERQTPAVIEHLLRGVDPRQHRRGDRAQQVAEGQPGLQHAQGEAAVAGRCVLGDERPGAGYFAAYGGALQNAQGQQQQRRPVTNLRVGRHQADQQARQRHHQNAQAEHTLAPQTVGEVRQQNAPQRPRQVAGDEYAEALQQAQPFRHVRREEQLAEDQREEHENDEVVDLQRAAQRGKAQGLVVGAAEARGKGSRVGRHWHGCPVIG
ncbi:hypothetical protein D3C79_756350 [compost metagenome]